MARATTVSTVLAVVGISASHAAGVTLNVVSARTEPKAFDNAGVVKGAVVSSYKYLINIDNTGTTTQRSPAVGTGCNTADAGYPSSCSWTSIAGAKGSSPIYTQGDQADFASPMTLPDGRYLVSVLADGYKLDGQHFTVSGATVLIEGAVVANATVTVALQPAPLPDAQIQAAVFEDISPVNSAPDLPAEHGMAGFQGHITDYLGEVTTNVYGHPLCSKYYATGALIVGSGGVCLSACYVVNNGVDLGTVAPLDAAGRCPVVSTGRTMTLPDGTTTPAPAGGVVEGKVKIPNLGPNRYALSVTPPDGSGWIQTTTLEGNHDWDAWVMEGATGLDTEFIIAGEPFPAIAFGYVPAPGTPSAVGSALPTSLGGTGSISGLVEAVKIYVPTTGGVAGLPGQIWGGLQGAKIDKPIEYPWVTLTNLGNGDTIVWAGQGGIDGKFTIPNVPAGSYTLTWWDEPQNQILDLVNVTVAAGENIDMGILPLSGWWTFFDGYVFNDTNRNGVKDAGEPGIPGYTLTMRKRENSLMDRGTTATTTDANGYYKFEAGYPMTQWLVMEAYDDLHYTTGITYQADNQPTPTTVIGAGVDVSVHPIIGLAGRMDWGKHTYDALGTNGLDPRNGGIVGTVSYDTTRNELDPRYAAVEDWQPSIPDLIVNLYLPVAAVAGCVRQPAVNATCDPSGRYALATDGSIAKGSLLNTYLTETWQRPTGCVARGVDGTPLVHGVDEQVLSTDDVNGECIEAPLMGVQFAPYATGQGTSDANFGAAVNGNYGFGDGCFVTVSPMVAGTYDPVTGACTTGTIQPLPARDYLVEVVIPNDTRGVPQYKVTREEDINIGNGDQFIPPAALPPACAGPLHTVNSTGNATFPGGPGSSPYETQSKPLCNVKLVGLQNGRSIAPAFNLYTDVPIPGRHWFIIIDDLNFSSNPKSTTFGEKAGMPFVPVGIYDYTNRLVTTVESDYNGLADVLLPSTNRINCPTPSGVCGNLYRYVGNDPGVPGRLNPNYNPLFRTIAAEFEVLPGLMVPADLAPTQVGVTVQLPGAQTTSPVMCKLDDATPQLFAVAQPYANVSVANGSVSISGLGFGATQGSGQVTLDGVSLPVTSWSNTSIAATVASTTTSGPKQLMVTAANGQSTINGLTFHVIKTAVADFYNPQLYEVGPGKPYAPAETLPATANHAIQNALNDAATFVGQSAANADRGALVVVYPNNPTLDNPRQNPRGAYYENLIVNSKVKLQGVGPGSPTGSVPGSIIDGAAFAGDSPVATDWYTTIGRSINAAGVPSWAGNQTIYDGAVISVFVPVADNNANSVASRTAFPLAYTAKTAPSIDGFDLRGGDQAGFPGNINAIGGGRTGLPGGLITQGGAIFANGYARNLQITNNVVQNNGGAYGTVRIGTPDLPAPDTNNHNESVVIAFNRVITNAGTNQAGGIGLFNGADNYQVRSNDICGNFSAEYGGGVSAIGYSPGGTIDKNRIYFNRSFDEGGGIMIAGALPANTAALSPGSGPVTISNNLVQANLANDDGGGIRFLMAGNYPMNVFNNFIVNNVSTHEGGGIALNDAPDVRFYNNTVMKNLTTATANTSNGTAAPAGLSTAANSTQLQATLLPGSAVFSNPLLFNNIFWDNRAGTRAGATVAGLAAPIDNWDLGVADGSGVLAPTNSIVQQAAATHTYTASPTNSVTDPAVVAPYDVAVTFNAWRNNPAFLGAILISADLPPNLMGNYHISNASPAYNLGAASKAGVAAPVADIDGEGRPAFGAFDAGADEVPGANANLGIIKNDGVATVTPGQALTYTITVSNAGPSAVVGATVTDTMPAALTGVTWTCVASNFSTCGAGSGSGNALNTTVNLANGGSATFTVNATVATTVEPGPLVNTATVALPTGTTDGTPGNNSATDTDTVVLALPVLSVLDNFNRTNANTLGSNWSQIVLFGNAAIRVNSNQAFAALFGWGIWNGTGNNFGAKQGAAFTFASTPATGSFLVMKGSGGNANTPQNFVRVFYSTAAGGTVTVATTINSGLSYATRGSFTGVGLANGDTMSAVANANGSVDVWKTTAANVTTFLGRVAIPTSGPGAWTQGTGGGRIGLMLPTGARIDNFSGGTLP
jgi:uncharacterized repeat protein (TIGR01451 family)